MIRRFTLTALVSLTVLCFAPTAFAGKVATSGESRPAIEACKGKAVGTKVKFKNRRGKMINAVCRLVAVPVRLNQPPAQKQGAPRPGVAPSGDTQTQSQPPIQLQVR